MYWENSVYIVEWSDFSNFYIKDITGSVPKEYNEIMISNFLADLILDVGIQNYKEKSYFTPTSYEELVTSNKYFRLGDDKVKIVGVINYDLSEFESLKKLSWSEYDEELDKYSPIATNLSDKTKNIYNKIYVNKEFVKKIVVNDESISRPVWKSQITKTGILVLENSSTCFTKLLKEFNSNNPYIAKSTYSWNLEEVSSLTNYLPNMKLIGIVILIIIIVLVIFLANMMSKFIIPKQKTVVENNQLYLFGNIFIIAIVSFVLSSAGLINIINYLKTSLFKDSTILNWLFIIETRQFLVLLFSVIAIGFSAYLIGLFRIKFIYENMFNK